MRLLITGGSGYLGSHLLKTAKDRFETFATFFSRSFDGGSQLDVRDADAVNRLFDAIRPGAVIHTAYEKSGDAALPIIADGSAHIARAARRSGARLAHLSTDVVFSGARGWYREDDPPDPINAYGRAKLAAERAVASAAPDAALVRTSLIYGHDTFGAHTKFVLDGIRANHPVTLFTDEYRCPIFVDDLVSALLELVGGDSDADVRPQERPPTTWRGPLHIAGAERVNRYEFGVWLARYHGYTTDNLLATTPDAVGMVRPKDCSLNTEKARALLRTRLRGVSEALRKG